MAECALEGCNKKARRRFCCNRHKDRYHNIHNPRGYYAHLHPDNMDAHDEMDTNKRLYIEMKAINKGYRVSEFDGNVIALGGK